MEPAKRSVAHSIILWVFLISFVATIGATFYHFLYKKDYSYLVEASCDPSIEDCYYRNCENPDDCPPNQLSVYKVYNVKAYDYEKCGDNSCKNECESGVLRCEVIACDEEVGDVCSLTETSTSY